MIQLLCLNRTSDSCGIQDFRKEKMKNSFRSMVHRIRYISGRHPLIFRFSREAAVGILPVNFTSQ